MAGLTSRNTKWGRCQKRKPTEGPKGRGLQCKIHKEQKQITCSFGCSVCYHLLIYNVGPGLEKVKRKEVNEPTATECISMGRRANTGRSMNTHM